MLDGLKPDVEERRNAELETLKDEEHSMMEMEALESELDTLMEETQAETFRRLAASSIINRGPSNGIAGADMRIISRENLETQGMLSGGDNNDN